MFELAVDTEMIAAKGAGTDDRDGKWSHGLLLGRGRLDSLTATSVELQKLGDLVLGLGRRRWTEAGGSGAGAADVGVRGDELEQVESDVFGATGRGVGAGIHECLSGCYVGDGSG